MPASTSPSPPAFPPSPTNLPSPPSSPWKTYPYTPTERHIFAPSPYKTLLLPHWRFSTPAAARASAQKLHAYFLLFEEKGDFVGADNARKFLQMGMTRAARYANHKGGRKYVKEGKKEEGGEGKGTGSKGKRRRVKVEDMEQQQGDWEGRAEKREASNVFRGYWERAKGSERYVRMKEEHVKRAKEWEKEQKAVKGR